MNTTTTNTLWTIGTRGAGTWATWRTDDGQHIVTVYDGWGITDEMTFSGRRASEFAENAMQLIRDEADAR